MPEEYIPIAKVAEHLPTRPHISTVFRWITRGVRGVKLETHMIGGRRYVTPSDLETFFARIEGKPLVGTTAAPNKLSPGRRGKAARTTLDRAGIK